MEFYGLEKLSLVDFDGHMCCTIFTNGCNFRCPFCHNSSLVEGGNKNKIISEDEVLEYLKKRKGVIDALSITGGEPTLHKGLPAFIERVKALGVTVKLDTNGSNPQMLKYLVTDKLVDYAAMDIKTSFPMYSLLVGIENFNTEKIEQSADFLLSQNGGYEFRTTLVHGLHTEEDFNYIANRLKGAKKYMLQKFIDNGTTLEKGYSEVPFDLAKKFHDILSKTMDYVGYRSYEESI